MCGDCVSLDRAHANFTVVAVALCLVYNGMSSIGPDICIEGGCFSSVDGGSESDTLEGVDIIEMCVLTDSSVVGGVGGGEYKGGGVGGRGNAEDIMSKDSGGIMSRSQCDFVYNRSRD
jgi:hypothetical protein